MLLLVVCERTNINSLTQILFMESEAAFLSNHNWVVILSNTTAIIFTPVFIWNDWIMLHMLSTRNCDSTLWVHVSFLNLYRLTYLSGTTLSLSKFNQNFMWSWRSCDSLYEAPIFRIVSEGLHYLKQLYLF